MHHTGFSLGGVSIEPTPPEPEPPYPPEPTTITVETNADSVKYDGTEHTVSGFVNETESGIPVQIGDFTYKITGLTASVSEKDVGTYTVASSGTAVVTDSLGRDVSGYITVNVDEKNLVITAREVTLRSADLEKVFDNTPLTNGDTPLTISGDGFAAEEGVTAEFTGTITLPGTVPNSYNYAATEGTQLENYIITKVEGTLTVTGDVPPYPPEPTTVTVETNAANVMYDGTEHTVSGFVNETENGIPFVIGGYTYYVTGLTATVSQINAGTYSVAVTGNPVVTDSIGRDCSAYITVDFLVNDLVITQRTVILISADLTKEYDGTPLTNGNTPLTYGGDDFVVGEGITPTFTGSQTVPGDSPNSFTYVAAPGTDLNNYDIRISRGTLTVTGEIPTVDVFGVDYNVFGDRLETEGGDVFDPGDEHTVNSGGDTYNPEDSTDFGQYSMDFDYSGMDGSGFENN